MKYLIYKLYIWLRRVVEHRAEREIRCRFSLDKTVRFHNPLQTKIAGNVKIGKNTYINSGRVITGKNSEIIIGENCAIGHNVNIMSITHDAIQPTGINRKHIEKSIIIEDDVWVGSNVFIREGVRIGAHAIIAANSVVNKDVEKGTVAGGVPVRIIRSKQAEVRG